MAGGVNVLSSLYSSLRWRCVHPLPLVWCCFPLGGPPSGVVMFPSHSFGVVTPSSHHFFFLARGERRKGRERMVSSCTFSFDESQSLSSKSKFQVSGEEEKKVRCGPPSKFGLTPTWLSTKMCLDFSMFWTTVALECGNVQGEKRR